MRAVARRVRPVRAWSGKPRRVRGKFGGESRDASSGPAGARGLSCQPTLLSQMPKRKRSRRRRQGKLTVSSSTSGTPARRTHWATASNKTLPMVLHRRTNAAGPCRVMSLYACVASWIVHLISPRSSLASASAAFCGLRGRSDSDSDDSLARRRATRSRVRRATSSALRASPEMPATDLAIFCRATSSNSGTAVFVLLASVALGSATRDRRASRIRFSSVHV